MLIGKQGVPIYVSYLTARPNGDKVAFADDVYKLDDDQNGGKVTTATAAK